MNLLESQLNKVRIPSDSQCIYKDECVYSFDTPDSPTGLYVSLYSFLGFGESFIDGYYKHTGNGVFLHIRREKHEVITDITSATNFQPDKIEGGPERKITRLAIGVEGGYIGDNDRQNYEIKEFLNIVVMPGKVSIPYPNDELPEIVRKSVEVIVSSESAIKKLQNLTVTGTWDGEVRLPSKYASGLKQLDNGVKIPPSGWKCQRCDLTNNLWLNLTDGSILCGRRFFDGSGGNEHAAQHYKETGYPLAVKLGTITGDGKGDVYSYPEDDMVSDPLLGEHLEHFGIKIKSMQKSDKSMVELELGINQRIGEWSVLTESESQLIPLAGPSLTGMKNLGNSCYLNSVMQVLFTIPDFIKRFVDGANKYFASYPEDPANDFNIQMAKLGTGLCSGKYSSISENTLDSSNNGIGPIMFKNLVGKNHPDFGTKQQQDAMDFFMHLINVLERNSENELNPMDAFKFTLEDRVECLISKKVKYTQRDEYCLSLTMPMHLATNINEVNDYEAKITAGSAKGNSSLEKIRPRITLQACIDYFAQTETVEQFYSTAIKERTAAKRYTRFASMPDYLLLHLKKFTFREDWMPVKLDISIDNVDELDLSFIRAKGLQPDEELLPEVDGSGPSPPRIDETVLEELIAMGFPPEAGKKAIYHTKNTGLEAATQWIMDHIGDSDLGEPFVQPGTEKSSDKAQFVADPEKLCTLMAMGFDEHRAREALKETKNNIERATDWIFTHAEMINCNMLNVKEVETGAKDEIETKSVPVNQNRDGPGQYTLVAFISHMGTSSSVGHYVCHIRKDDQWVIFNDNKVAISQNPPKDMGYLYLYKRQSGN